MPLFPGPLLSASTITPVTIANSTTETVVTRLTVPGGQPKVGSAWEGTCVGVVSTATTGSPQITANLRIGGLTGTSIASIVIGATTSQTNVSFWIGFHAGCVTTGVSGTWVGSVHDVDVLTGPAANVVVSPTPVTQDTTISNDLVLTLQWGAAVSGNSVTMIMSSIFQMS
jgi:hypothetical protein